MDIKIQGFICSPTQSYSKEQTFTFFNFKPSEAFVVVRPHLLETTIPDDWDPRAAMVTLLKQEREKLRAEFAARITSIERQISELLAISA